MLVSKKHCEPQPTQHKPQCEQVEYGCVGQIRIGVRIRHVDFMLFAIFFLAFSGGIWAQEKKRGWRREEGGCDCM